VRLPGQVRFPWPASRWLLSTLLLALAFCGSGQAGAEDDLAPDPSVAAIDQFVTREMDQQRIPGLSLAVTVNNELIFTKGYGLANVELKSPALAESVYEVASITKQFTAVAILELVQAHQLTLDDPLGHLLPGGPDSWKKITVRQLLTHTSGIPDFDDGNVFDVRRDYSEDELVHLAATLPLKFPAGSRWSYSNTGYVLLGIIVHRVSGKSYADFLRDGIFSPLHMVNTRVNSESDIIPFRANGYRLEDGVLKNQEFLSAGLRGTGDGGIVSTVVDMAKWEAGLQSGALLPPDVWQQVFTPVALNSGKTFPYGFGWFIREQAGHPYYEHSGNLQGFASHFLRFPRARVSVVVLANLSQADAWEIAHGVASLVRPDLKPPADGPIEDHEPAITQRFREVLSGLRAGKLKEDAFDDDGRNAYNADVLRDNKEALAKLPPFGDFVLIGRVEVGDDVEYRYWVQVGSQKWLLEAALDADGKIERMQFNPL
jgi:CubicO group peptidase (beta-lactamase class C family)